jgi:hypothetical protein
LPAADHKERRLLLTCYAIKKKNIIKINYDHKVVIPDLIHTAKYPCTETRKGKSMGRGKKQNNLPKVFETFKEFKGTAKPTLGINL